MAAARSRVLSKLTVLRWDLDKTYLVSDFESLRGLLRIPFEKAADKRALPGVAALVKSLRRASAERGAATSVSFVTASPPQIGRAIREKLLLDGIEFDEIRFKDQLGHLVRGRFEALREQVGFKLAELLQSARAGGMDAEELLFGDDWESDALIYSLYADAVEGRLGWSRLEPLLVQAGVHPGYREAIREALAMRGPSRRVRAIFILRARPRDAVEFEAFGSRLFWFDSYFECALVLHALGELDARGVLEVAEASRSGSDALTSGFEAVATRWPRLRREHLTVARRALLEAGRIRPVESGSLWRRALTHLRVRSARPPLAASPAEVATPDYEALLRGWTHRGRREREATTGHGT